MDEVVAMPCAKLKDGVSFLWRDEIRTALPVFWTFWNGVSLGRKSSCGITISTAGIPPGKWTGP